MGEIEKRILKEDELFEYLEKIEEVKEQKTNKDSKVYKSKKKKVFLGQKYPPRARIYFRWDEYHFLQFFSNETYYIFCPEQDSILPTSWDKLPINFENKNMRYCEECDKNVYKVENHYFYQKCVEKNQCMALSINTLKFLGLLIASPETVVILSIKGIPNLTAS